MVAVDSDEDSPVGKIRAEIVFVVVFLFSSRDFK